MEEDITWLESSRYPIGCDYMHKTVLVLRAFLHGWEGDWELLLLPGQSLEFNSYSKRESHVLQWCSHGQRAHAPVNNLKPMLM